MLTLEQVKDVEAREQMRYDFMKAQKRNYITGEESASLPQVTNEERSAVEQYYWHADKPEKYFLYINEAMKTATTWTGDMGDKRIAITVYGNNGVNYYGTFYKSAGDYARVKAMKQSRAA